MGKQPKLNSARGRPELVAPRGYVTLREAAATAGVSYSTAYKRAKSGDVRALEQGGGIFVLARDAAKIAVRDSPEYEDGRRAIQVRPSLVRYEQWERAANRAGSASVALWIAGLADRAAATGRPVEKK